jgi:hypothetical protein
MGPHHRAGIASAMIFDGHSKVFLQKPAVTLDDAYTIC